MAGACGIYEALWLARLHLSSAHALYLHMPFCVRKCAYCDFASWETEARDPLMAAYAEALCRLSAQAADAGLLDGCKTAYVGGGTPTLAGAGLVRLVTAILLRAPLLAELTCEANPDSLSDGLLDGLREAGCTRLSIGVQSLSDAELSELGRVHTARRALERVKAAVATGVDVSCDLMCATPRQTDASWRRSLVGVCEAGVGHVSVYPLQIEEDTPLGRAVGDDEPMWNDPEVQARRMEQSHELLVSQGLRRYEVASYARPGKECRHNQAYWTAVPYLGLGTNASSMLTREAYERLREVSPQLPGLDETVRRVRLTCTSSVRAIVDARTLKDVRYDIETLDDRQAAAEDLMLAMRMVRGADLGLVEHARAVIGATRVDDALSWCHRQGLAEPVGGSWVPTTQGWLLGNRLYGRMWGLAD